MPAPLISRDAIVRPRGGVWAGWIVVAALSATVGCDFFAARQQIATVPYRVTGTLTDNSCGPQSAPIERTVVFRADIELSYGRATWRVTANNASVSGVFNDTTRNFRFAAESYQSLRPADRRTGYPGCVLRRLDVIDGTASANGPAAPPDAQLALFDSSMAAVDASAFDGATRAADGAIALPVRDDGPDALADGGNAPASFVATETIVYAPVEGADCATAIGNGQGQYAQLPCTQRVEMHGERMTEP